MTVYFQLKSSLQLHIDGTSPVAEDIGRQVCFFHFCSKKYCLFSCAVTSNCVVHAQLLTYGRRIPVAELFARVDAVDVSTIKRVANRFIFDQVGVTVPKYSLLEVNKLNLHCNMNLQDIAIAAMGPIKTLPDYNWFRRRTFMLRY